MNLSDLAVNLRNERLDQNLTQSELEDMCGFASTYISQIERGKRRNPSVDNLITIANVLDVSIDWLVGR